MPADRRTAAPTGPRRRPGPIPGPRRTALPLAMALAAAVIGPPAASAQGLNLGGGANDTRPIDITADSGIEWQQQAQVYVARGNAVATRGTSEVHADTLTAHYRPSKSKTAEGGNEVYRLDADGHVVIKGPTQTVVGDQAIYDVDRQLAVITGKALKMTTPTDVVTARDSLEWYDDKQIAVARGDAIAVRADRHIRADVLTAHMIKNPPGTPPTAKPRTSPTAKPAAAAVAPAKPQTAAGKPGAAAGPLGDGGESSRISRVDAQGNVMVWNATDVGRGDYGVYNADTGIVTLLGNVTITRAQNVIKGQYAVVDLNRNISRMMTVAAKPGTPAPRVEGVFVRQDAAAVAGSPGSPAKSPNAAKSPDSAKSSKGGAKP
jgi:lipopolysaccharide export system protein LptA